MTLPRRLRKLQVHMVSRRCTERRLLLTSTKLTDAIVRYCLAVCLQASEVELYALMVMSNHYHMVLGDPTGELSKFMARFDMLVARALNAHYGRGEAFWKQGSYDNTEIHGYQTLIEKLVYVLVNPVKDGLVARPESWPGLKSSPEDMGVREEVVARPLAAFFGGRRPKDWKPTAELSGREQRSVERRLRRELKRARAEGKKPSSRMPDQATLRFSVPFGVKDRDEFVREVRARLEGAIERVHEDRRLAGKVNEKGQVRFLGVKKIRAQDPHESAGSVIPTFKLNPRIACQDTELRKRVLLELKAWRTAYRKALKLWRRRKRRTVFPEGTVKMVALHRCRVGPLEAVA